jgi:Tol biopolymer transport system component/tRNA A-37 threonylcarbamoyl transferase component Bud32
MSDTPSRLTNALAGEYTIEREIGAGGMATVYVAHDVKHDRKVAVKVLRPDIAATLGADRFLREVRIAANLTHPHILGLHDSGEADGFLYYVMPFIAGESLRDRLAREGELPVHDAVRLIREIVDALGYAHAHGVVHRDVKPDNVLIAGRHAMVTDFGVAKAVSEATGRNQLTTAGVALGTPAYMAPEQASAEPHVDHRADIYAVGVLAYELLTGQLPFTGSTQQQILAAHLTEAPRSPRDLRSTLTPALEQFVLKCLEKRPSDRWQSAEEMLPVLEALSTPSGGITPAGSAPVRAVGSRTNGLRIPILTGAVVAIAVVGFLGWSSLRRPGGAPVRITNTMQVTRADDLERDAEISPDGREVAYQARGQVFVRDLEGGRPIPLTPDIPAGLRLPRWTEDGRSIVFSAPDRASAVVPRFGGAVRALTAGTVWDLRAGKILSQRGDTLFLADSTDPGSTRVVTVSVVPYSARLSPDGRWVAYVTGNRDDATGNIGNVAPSTIWVVPAGGGESIEAAGGSSLNSSPTWLGERRLVFISNRDGSKDLYVLRLSRSGEPEGEPYRFTTGLEAHSVSVSRDGLKAVYGSLRLRRNLTAFPIVQDRVLTKADGVPLTPGNFIVEGSDLSWDGDWLAFDANLEGSSDVYLMAVDGGEPRRLTTHPAEDFGPSFFPDGKTVAFHSTRGGTRGIYAVDVETGAVELVYDSPDQEFMPQVAPDGQHIVFARLGTGGSWIDVVTRDGPEGTWGVPRTISAGLWAPDWSPVGEVIVAHRLVNSSPGLVLLDPNGREQDLLSAETAGFRSVVWPAFGPRGRVIFFRGEDDMGAGIFSVPVAGGEPRLLFRYSAEQPVFAGAPAVGADHFYLTIAVFETDIYAMNLALQ